LSAAAYLAVAQCFAALRSIRLQQDAYFQQLLRWIFAGTDQAIKLLALCRAELHDIFLYGDFFGGREPTLSKRYGSIDSTILLTVNDGGTSFRTTAACQLHQLI
jgi:hypothetical protein